MASPTPKRTPFDSRYPPRPAGPRTEDVDPRWLVRALAIALAAAAVLGYLSICLLVFQGGWQRMLSPSPKVNASPAIPFQSISFDAAGTGRPRLSGWYLPGSDPAAPTILFFHGGTGSLGDTVPSLTLLHQANVNLFAIDYRGFGVSEPTHPNEIRMGEDATAALTYLTSTRHVRAASIVVYGQGLGAVLATNLVNQHAELSGVILDTPDPQALLRVVEDPRSRLLPMRLLVRDHFDIAAALASCTKPKLLLTGGPFGGQPVRGSANRSLFLTAPDPKLIVTFASAHSEAAYLQALSRFLDQYVAQKAT